MLVSDLASAMHSIAPLDLAEEWDNVGLLFGDGSRALAGPVMLTIDLTTAVVDEALAMNAGAIIAYHPPIFRPFKRLTADSMHGSLLLRLIERGVAIYSPHTALDAAPGGVTDWLIDQACETPPAPGMRAALTPAADREGNQTHKIVTFVPKDAAERVRAALAAAGAGSIGSYELCCFTIEGRGSFKGNDSSSPTFGQRGQLESVDEVRLEMVCGQSSLAAAIEALRSVHPYEEPAVDVYTLAPKPRRGAGSGRIVTLERPTSAEVVTNRLKQRLKLSHVQLALPPQAAVLSRIAAVPGSGAALLDAAMDAGADCFITGEMKHHEVLGALDRGCAVILAGHTETERNYLPVLATRLKGINTAFDARVSRADASPLRLV